MASTRKRTATITLIGDGGILRHARIIGAGNGGADSDIDFFIAHDDGRCWLGQDEIAEIAYDPCGKCGQAIVEDGYPFHGEIWHLTCAESSQDW